jgi:hypothetical protein
VQLGKLIGAQSFMDAHLVHSTSNSRKVQQQPVSDQLLLQDDNSSVADVEGLRGIGFPGSVVFNTSHFLLYYHAYGNLVRRVSANGLEWSELVNCSLLRLNEHRHFDMSVMFDKHESNSRYKYKMAYLVDEQSSVGVAVSSDGITWVRAGFVGGFGDTVPSVNHDDSGPQFDVITRQQFYTPRYYREIRGTVIMRGKLEFNWTLIDKQVEKEKMKAEKAVKKERQEEQKANELKGKEEQKEQTEEEEEEDDEEEEEEEDEGKWPLSWKADEISYLNLDMDGKDERYRRHLYSFTRTKMANGLYLGMAQILNFRNYEFPNKTKEGSLFAVPSAGGAFFSKRDRAEQQAMGFLADRMSIVRTHLVTSRDGLNWDLGSIYAGQPFLAQAHCGFDLVASQIVTHNGYHHVYYECRKGNIYYERPI